VHSSDQGESLRGEPSSPITGETRYTISYIDRDGATHTKQATVHIISHVREL
jgi:hypothetical protein